MIEGNLSPPTYKKWYPLESNPDTINKYAESLGLNLKEYCFQDVLCLEDWALEMIPKPIPSILFLYPLSTDDNNEIIGSKSSTSYPPHLFYMKQLIENSCGTIALLHSIINAQISGYDIIDGNSYFQNFINSIDKLNPNEIGEYLVNDEVIDAFQQAASAQGQSAQVSINEDVDTHFICFTLQGDFLYELDGRKSSKFIQILISFINS